MKNNLLRIFFEWALITSVLMSVGFFFWFYYTTHATRVAKYSIINAEARFQKNHDFMGRLLAECRGYAKTNADMAHLFDSAKPQMQQAPAAPAPAPRSRTK